MRALLLAQGMWLPAFLGWGCLVERCFRMQHKPPGFSLGELGLLGLAAWSITATLLNFFFPIQSEIGWFVCVGGWALLVLRWKDFQTRMDAATVFVLAAMGVITAAQVFGATPVPDAGSVHIPIVEWIRRHPLPLGLANVHSLAGYNSIWFPLGALVQLAPLKMAHFFSAEAIAITFFYQALWTIFYRGRYAARATRALPVFCLTLFVINVLVGFESEAGFNSTFTPMSVFAMASLVALIRAKVWRDASSALLALTFAAVALAIHVSAWVFSTGVLLGVGILFIQERDHFPLSIWFVRAALLLFFTLAPWSVRGVMTSGCVAFPNSPACFERLPWTATLEKRQAIRAAAQAASGQCLLNPALTEQISCWREQFLQPRAERLWIPFLVAMLGLFGLVLSRVPLGFDWIPLVASQGFWLASGISLSALAVWFTTIPEPASGYPFLALTAATLFSAGILVTTGAGTLLRVTPMIFFICLTLVAARAAKVSRENQAPTWISTEVKVPTWSNTFSDGTTANLPRLGEDCLSTAASGCEIPPPPEFVAERLGKRYLFLHSKRLPASENASSQRP